jgi:hypothetical protein
MAASFGFSGNQGILANPINRAAALGGRLAGAGRQIHDAASDPEYTWTEAQQLANFTRCVPLFRGDTAVGVIALVRSRVELLIKRFSWSRHLRTRQ